MSPDALMVERDWLLEHGRSVEEVEAMQLVGRPTSAITAAILAAPADEYGEGASIGGGYRCAIYRYSGDWWVGISPRNGHGASVEGSWADWVELARNIIAVEAARLSLPESTTGASTPVQREGR